MTNKWHWIATLLLGAVSPAFAPAPVHALNHVYPLTQDTFYTEVYYVGMVDVTNDGITNRIAMVCVDEIGTSGSCSCTGTPAATCTCVDSRDRTIPIGNGGGLTDDVVVHGDIASSSAGGRDEMYLVAYNGFRPASNSFCGDNLLLGGIMRSTWNQLIYTNAGVTRYLDLWGDEGNDVLNNGFSGANTWMRGDDGTDILLNRATYGVAHGLAGNDAICSTPAGNVDELRGHDGQDCLADTSWSSADPYMGWAYFSCGTNPAPSGGLRFMDYFRWDGTPNPHPEIPFGSAGYMDPSPDVSCEFVYSPSQYYGSFFSASETCSCL